MAEHVEYAHEHARTVAEGVELRLAALRAFDKIDGHLDDAHLVVEGEEGHLGLELEAVVEHRETLDEAAREAAVAGHDVAQLGVEDAVDGRAHQVVAEAVELAAVLLEVGAVGEAVADGHVGLAGLHRTYHLTNEAGGISVVAVDHHVEVGIDITEHRAHHRALALHPLAAHDGTSGGGFGGGVVAAVVVIDVYLGLGELAAEILHDFAYGEALVVARYQYCSLFHGSMYVLFEDAKVHIFPELAQIYFATSR